MLCQELNNFSCIKRKLMHKILNIKPLLSFIWDIVCTVVHSTQQLLFLLVPSVLISIVVGMCIIHCS